MKYSELVEGGATEAQLQDSLAEALRRKLAVVTSRCRRSLPE